MSDHHDPTCADLAAALPALMDDEARGGASGMPLALRRHLSRCPECTSELETYRALRTATAGLVNATATPPPGLRDALVAIPSGATRLEDVRSHLARHRGAYVGGLAVALGATGAALWRSRRRGLATA
jgi:anti-sigma factor RsiW